MSPHSGGHIYVLGGVTEGGDLTPSMERYSVAANTWQLLAPMPGPRAQFRVAAVSDRILVVGGIIGGAASDLVHMFNISTKSWLCCTLLPSPRADFALATLSREFLDPEVIEECLRFKGDAVIERTRRIIQPLSMHFSWSDS